MTSGSKAIVAAVAASSVFTGSASAAQILSFEADPISPALPELVFDLTPGKNLGEGPGSIGNGPGIGGLGVQAPFPGLAAPGAAPTPGGTRFTDATLRLNGFAAPGPAFSFGGIAAQPLAIGSFEFLSTDPDGPGPLLPVLLLSGTIANSTITGLLGTTVASVVSSTVTYTGGIVATAMVANGLGLTGETSWSLLDVSRPLAIDTDGKLDRFAANASGLFNAPVIPEPTGLGAVAVGAAAFLRRRK